MAHLHEIEDRDPYFVIDPDTRTIRNMSSTKTVLAQFDHNSEIFTFGIPREVDGHDMMLCDKVQVHYLNGTNPGVYEIDLGTERELRAAEAEDEEDIVLHSWLISDNATQIAAPLSFALVFMCTRTVTEEDPVSGEDVEKTVVDYRWRTLPHTGINVGASINTSDATVEKYADILLKWYAELTAAYGDINTAKTEGIEAVEAAKDKAVVDAQNEISNWVQNNQSGIIDDLQEAFSESYTELEADVATIKGILGADEGTESVAGLVDRVDTLETDVGTLGDNIRENQVELSGRINGQDDVINSLRGDLESTDSDVSALDQRMYQIQSSKVDKLTPNGTIRVYAQDAAGNETSFVASSANNSNRVILRDGNGAFSVNDAALPLHPLSKRAFDYITGVDASQWGDYRSGTKSNLVQQIENNTAQINNTNSALAVLDAKVDNVGISSYYQYLKMLTSGTRGVEYELHTIYDIDEVSGESTGTILDQYYVCTSINSTSDTSISLSYRPKHGSVPLAYINEGVFMGNSDVTEIYMPPSIRGFMNNQFKNCTALTRINIEDLDIDGINSGAFYGCENLKTIDIPPTVKGISYDAFAYCTSLTNVVIPDSVTYIGDSAFAYCALETVVIKSRPEYTTPHIKVGDSPFINPLSKEGIRNLIIDGATVAPFDYYISVFEWEYEIDDGDSEFPASGYARVENVYIKNAPTIQNYNMYDESGDYSHTVTYLCGTNPVNIFIDDTTTSIGADVFRTLNRDVENIYVPWSEGEVANAPWGATNATIHYNYTYTED